MSMMNCIVLAQTEREATAELVAHMAALDARPAPVIRSGRSAGINRQSAAKEEVVH